MSAVNNDTLDSLQINERDKIRAYIQFHDLEEVLSEVVDVVVGKRPDNPLIELSLALAARSKLQKSVMRVELLDVSDLYNSPAISVCVLTGYGTFGTTAVVHGTENLVKQDILNILNETLVKSHIVITDQRSIDNALESIQNRIGNSICLAASLAICQAGAKITQMSIVQYVEGLSHFSKKTLQPPLPNFSILEYLENATHQRPFKIFVSPARAQNLLTAIQHTRRLLHCLQEEIVKLGVSTADIGHMGGFVSPHSKFDEAIDLVQSSIERYKLASCGDVDGDLNFSIGVDFTAGIGVHPPPTAEEILHLISKRMVICVVDADRDDLQEIQDGMQILIQEGFEIDKAHIIYRSRCQAYKQTSHSPSRYHELSLPITQCRTLSELLHHVRDAMNSRCVRLTLEATTEGQFISPELYAAIAVGAGISRVSFGGLLCHASVQRYSELLSVQANLCDKMASVI